VLLSNAEARTGFGFRVWVPRPQPRRCVLPCSAQQRPFSWPATSGPLGHLCHTGAQQLGPLGPAGQRDPMHDAWASFRMLFRGSDRHLACMHRCCLAFVVASRRLSVPETLVAMMQTTGRVLVWATGRVVLPRHGVCVLLRQQGVCVVVGNRVFCECGCNSGG
jgi:hypothetical protein